MSDVKWIKISTDIFDDEKILLIESLPDSYAIITCWFKLLCLAGKMNNSGVFMMSNRIAYTDKMLAIIFRMKESTVTMALKTFQQFGMIEIVDDVITIPNWGKHQSVDKIEAKNEYQKNYMREYRAKQKKLACKTNSNTNSNANVSSVDNISNSYSFSNNSNISNLIEVLKDYKNKDYINNNINLYDCINKWFKYKDEKKPKSSNHYGSRVGIETLLNKIVSADSKYGTSKTIETIEYSIANNYQGIVFDRLEESKQKSNVKSGDNIFLQIAKDEGMI